MAVPLAFFQSRAVLGTPFVSAQNPQLIMMLRYSGDKLREHADVA